MMRCCACRQRGLWQGSMSVSAEVFQPQLQCVGFAAHLRGTLANLCLTLHVLTAATFGAWRSIAHIGSSGREGSRRCCSSIKSAAVVAGGMRLKVGAWHSCTWRELCLAICRRHEAIMTRGGRSLARSKDSGELRAVTRGCRQRSAPIHVTRRTHQTSEAHRAAFAWTVPDDVRPPVRPSFDLLFGDRRRATRAARLRCRFIFRFLERPWTFSTFVSRLGIVSLFRLSGSCTTEGTTEGARTLVWLDGPRTHGGRAPPHTTW
jgi:hypothetical protein